MTPEARFIDLARCTARLRARPMLEPSVTPASRTLDQARAAVGTAGSALPRRASGGSFIGPWREAVRRLTRAELAKKRAAVRADLEATAEKDADGFDQVERDHEQFELIPPDEQQLPDRLLRGRVGLPPPAAFYWSAARAR